jgi:hypothetical protein
VTDAQPDLNNLVQAAAISIEPAFQTVDLVATESAVPTQLNISNTSSSDLVVTLSTLDFRQSGSDGSIAFIDKPSNPLEPLFASYLVIEPQTLLLTAGSTQQAVVTVKNSPSLTPGGHYAAVLVKAQAVNDATATSAIIPALSAQLLVRKVGGEQYGLTVTPVSQLPALLFHIPSRFTLRYTNTGNTHVVPHGKVVVRDSWGTIVREASLNQGSLWVLPAAQREVTEQFVNQTWSWPVAFLTVEVQGSTKPGNVTFVSQTSVVYIAPYLIFLILAVILTGMYVWWRTTKKLQFHPRLEPK